MNNRAFKKILYASDLGINSREAFDKAIQLASSINAELIFMHAINNSLIEHDEAIESYISDALFKKIRKSKLELATDKIQKRLEGLKHEDEALYQSVNIETVVREGRATAEILAVAKEKKADLIIIGSRTHSTISELLLGSTATKIMQQSKIPVMVIPLFNKQH